MFYDIVDRMEHDIFHIDVSIVFRIVSQVVVRTYFISDIVDPMIVV